MLRFAPSPTGDMHIGNLRAAIFNYIVAKQRGEKFLIRIEDTDSARNIKGADKEILAILNLFGLFWDKLVYQSENFPLHRKLAQNLIEKNKAFYCYATKDFLEQKRAEASAQKRAFRYKDEWAEICKSENGKPAIRLKGIAESSAGNSVLGMQFRTCENFQASTDSSLVESPKIFTNTKATPQSLPLRFCESQNLDKNNSVRSTQTRPLRGAKNREEASSSASADFLLEAEKRGSPPKSEKAELFGNTIKKSWGERGGGCSPFCEKESELSGENGGKVAESTLDSADSLAMAKNKDFAQSISFFDAIKGECKFSANEIDSFVILREDTIPTYNFACAVDDMLYDISFIIRGEDHTSNTPKQMLIHRALGYDKAIEYAHLPIILNDEGRKMSKRESESSVKWLLSQGFLPRAIVNYLLLMGNNPPCEIFSLDEAIAWFDLSQLSKSPVRFDINQLRHINREHLKRLSEDEMGLLLAESNEKLRQVVGNSVLGMQFRTKNAESSTDSATPTQLISFDSFAKRAAPPAPLPLRTKKLRFFAFRGRASLFPLLAKNQRSHYCSLDSDFLHHEAGEFSGASHGLNSDSANPQNSQNLVQNKSREAQPLKSVVGGGGGERLRNSSPRPLPQKNARGEKWDSNADLSAQGCKVIDSADSQNLKNGLPRRFCESARNDGK